MLSATQPNPLRLEVPDTPYEYKKTSAKVGSADGGVPHGDGQLAHDRVERSPERSSTTSRMSAAWSGAKRSQQEVVELLRYLDNSIYPEAGIIPMSREGQELDSWWRLTG
jgi:hypothetical protein